MKDSKESLVLAIFSPDPKTQIVLYTGCTILFVPEVTTMRLICFQITTKIIIYTNYNTFISDKNCHK